MFSTSPRSAASRLLGAVLLLSGWAVAIGLAWRVREISSSPDHPPAEAAMAAPENLLERAFREFSSRPEFAGAAVGFCLLDETGAPLYASPLAATALCPASSLKTLTTGAAFSILGPDFRFETTLAASAPLSADGTLNGDLILVGSGDPTLSTEDLNALADAALAGGLKSVTGRVLVDATIFPENPVSDHWVWGDIGNGYGAGAFGLNLDHNRCALHFNPSAQPGGIATLIEHSPMVRGTVLRNAVTTGPAGSGDQVVAYAEPYGRTITLRGTVPAGQNDFTVSGAVPDPPALAAELLRARLAAGGAQFTDPPQASAPATDPRPILARHASIPLAEIIDHLHRVSDNLEAQCLFLTIGHQRKTDPATAIREYWENAGVDFAGLRLLDGSGLARANVIRPLDLARVNYAARHSAQGQRYFDSLSAYLDGQVHAKIGAMSGVKTQVGFLRTAQNRELTFALMVNGLAGGREFWMQLEKLLAAVRTADLPAAPAKHP